MPLLVLESFIIIFLSLANVCLADDQIVVGNFSEQLHNNSLPEHWEALTFDGIDKHTSYTQFFDGKTWSIQATSFGSSSSLIRKIAIDSSSHPIISFRWKIQDIIEPADLTRKDKDDAPARVYVTFAYDATRVKWWEMVKFEAIRIFHGEYPPIASLLYVWASHDRGGEIMVSPYTSRVRIIVLEAGSDKKGLWLSETRNIREDYRKAFSSTDVPMISGVAIMTDTDNTGSQAVAWYGDIIFSTSPPAIE